MNKNAIIYIAGHGGMVGSAIHRNLLKRGFIRIITKTRKELDLLNQSEVLSFFKEHSPEYVFLSAAKVGGIIGNKTYPAEFISQNLTIQNNIIHAAHAHGVKKLLFLGSSCIIKIATQPL
jgi:GDP-L-fucose synthase